MRNLDGRASALAALLAMGSLASLASLACEPRPVGVAGASTADAGGEAPVQLAADAPKRPSLKELGPTGRRVSVLALPLDASVEVDKAAVRRRNGVVDLLGKVGDKHRVRVFKGSQSVERELTIDDAEDAGMPVIDLNARAAPAASGSAAVPAASGSAAVPASLPSAAPVPAARPRP